MVSFGKAKGLHGYNRLLQPHFLLYLPRISLNLMCRMHPLQMVILRILYLKLVVVIIFHPKYQTSEVYEFYETQIKQRKDDGTYEELLQWQLQSIREGIGCGSGTSVQIPENRHRRRQKNDILIDGVLREEQAGLQKLY